MQNRINWIDSAKGIAIILVVYGHIILGLHNAGMWNTFNYHLQYSFIYTFHMPLFFMLSGLFLSKWVSRDANQAITQKARRLLIPYVVWSIIQGVVMIFLSTDTNSNNDWTLLMRIPTTPFSQFWYLYDLFFMFIFYYLLFRFLRLKLKWILLGALFIAPFASYINFWQFYRLFYYFFFFLLGSIIWEYRNKLNQIPVIKSGICFIGVNIVYFLLPLSQFLHNIFGIVVALVGIAFVIAIVMHVKIKFIEIIGQLSMPIYLMHILAMAGARIFLLKLGITNLELQIIFGLIMGIGLPLIGYGLMYKLHLHKLLF